MSVPGPELVDGFARWTSAYPIAVKNFLRPAARRGWEKCARVAKMRVEVGALLTDADAAALLGTAHELGSPPTRQSPALAGSGPAGADAAVSFHSVAAAAVARGAPVAPLLVLLRLRQLAYVAAGAGGGGPAPEPALGAAIYRQLNSQIDQLATAWGAMERINATPLPFVYVVRACSERS